MVIDSEAATILKNGEKPRPTGLCIIRLIIWYAIPFRASFVLWLQGQVTSPWTQQHR